MAAAMAVTGPGRGGSGDNGLTAVGHHGQTSFVPRRHTTLEIDGVEPLLHEEFGGPRRTPTRTADADDVTFAVERFEVVGERGEWEVSCVGASTSGELAVLSNVEEKGAIGNELLRFEWGGHEVLVSIDGRRAPPTLVLD